MSNAKIESALKTFGVTEVYFGSQGFRIYTPEELPDAQIGYSKHPDGTDLAGEKNGDWQRTWTVVGIDPDLGDPYFVDASENSLPVYTAMHGAGAWDPKIVSPSLHNFLNSLSHLRAKSNQSEPLLDPDETTLTDEEDIKTLEQELSLLNGEDEFWMDFFDFYVHHWLAESEDEDEDF